jgi:hypothetical protein
LKRRGRVVGGVTARVLIIWGVIALILGQGWVRVLQEATGRSRGAFQVGKEVTGCAGNVGSTILQKGTNAGGAVGFRSVGMDRQRRGMGQEEGAFKEALRVEGAVASNGKARGHPRGEAKGEGEELLRFLRVLKEKLPREGYRARG